LGEKKLTKSVSASLQFRLNQNLVNSNFCTARVINPCEESKIPKNNNILVAQGWQPQTREYMGKKKISSIGVVNPRRTKNYPLSTATPCWQAEPTQHRRNVSEADI